MEASVDVFFTHALPRTCARMLARAQPAQERRAEPIMKVDPRLSELAAGKMSAQKARELGAQILFPGPTKRETEAVLNATSADDGLSAMRRIKTVKGANLDKLKRAIVVGLSAPDDPDALKRMYRKIKHLVGNDPGKSTGMNYRAKRIIRTEGYRVAETAMRRSWDQAGDLGLMQGLRAMTANDVNVRPEHWQWHNKLYLRRAKGTYIHPTLGRLPNFPAASNCRCYTVPELAPRLTAAVTAARYAR